MSIRRSLVLSALERYSAFMITFVSTIVLARLLTPAEIGVYTVGMAIVAFGQTFRDFGVTQYLIQEPELTGTRIRAALTVTCGMAWSIAAVLALLAPFAADFYDEAGLRDVLLVLAANFLLLPLSSTAYAILRRDMRFGAIYAINIASSLANALVAIGLALLGFGYMSLAWAALAATITTALFTLGFQRGRDHFVPGFADIKRVLSFGSLASLSSLFRDIGGRGTELVMGKMLGFGPLGLYSRSAGLLAMIGRLVNDAILPVALPAFSTLRRAGTDPAPALLRAVALLSAVTWPFYALVAVLAEPLILVLLGPQWEEAAPLVVLMSAFYISGITLYIIVPPALVAYGRIDLVVKVDVASNIARIALVALASPYGLYAVTIAVGVTGFPVTVTYLVTILRLFKVSPADLIATLGKSAALTGASVTPAVLLYIETNGSGLPAVLVLMMTGIVAGAVWVGVAFWLRHPVWDEAARALVAAREAYCRLTGRTQGIG